MEAGAVAIPDSVGMVGRLDFGIRWMSVTESRVKLLAMIWLRSRSNAVVGGVVLSISNDR